MTETENKLHILFKTRAISNILQFHDVYRFFEGRETVNYLHHNYSKSITHRNQSLIYIHVLYIIIKCCYCHQGNLNI